MEAVGQLTGGIAHDFNNLLMAILGSLEIVQSRLTAEPRISPFLDNAVAAARRGASLTERMLAFARKQQLDLQSVDLPGLVDGMMELIKGMLDSTIAIETRFPERTGRVRADLHQLEAALLNLVVNARDAMPDGGSILIAAEAMEVGENDPSNLEPGEYVCLSVEDTGEGMDATTLARATEPFFTTKGVGKGTGLGLSMVHGLAEQLRGRLLLDSRPGIGTKVRLCLPILQAQAAQEAQAGPAEVPPAREEGAANAARLTVLAVDDDALVLMNTAAMLEDLGHQVVEAHVRGRRAGSLPRERGDRPCGNGPRDAEDDGQPAGRDHPQRAARSPDHTRHRLCRVAAGRQRILAASRQAFQRARACQGDRQGNRAVKRSMLRPRQISVARKQGGCGDPSEDSTAAGSTTTNSPRCAIRPEMRATLTR